MNSLPPSIDYSFRPGEKMIQRLKISVPLAERRSDQALIAFAVAVVFSAMLFALLPMSGVRLNALNLAILLVISAGLWTIFDRFLKVTFPDYSELVITNQRLILRAGAAYTEWVSDYDNEVEVLVLAELSSFVVRPSGSSSSPREVYVKSVSPFQNARQLADLLRSFRENASFVSSSTINSIASGAEISSISSSNHLPIVPPGIAVTHACLSHQLRSLIASIPSIPSVSAIPVLQSKPVLSVRGNGSQSTEMSQKDDTRLELGDTGYQFGVDK